MKKAINYLPLFLLLILLAVRFGADFNGLYGQDSHEYLRFAKRLVAFFQNGSPPGDYFWPVNYPLFSAFFALVLPDAAFAAQLVSMLSFVLLISYATRLIALLNPQASPLQTRVYLFLTLFLSPFMFRASLLVMSDILAAFFVIAAIFYALNYRRDAVTLDFVLSVFFAAAAVMTRYAAAVLLIVPLAGMLPVFRRKFSLAAFVFALAATAVCLIPHLLIRGGHAAAFLQHPGLLTWSIDNFFHREFITSDGHAVYRFPNLVYAFSFLFHPGFFWLALPLIFFFKTSDLKNVNCRLLLAELVIYAAFLAGIPYQNLRFLIPGFPLVAVIFFPAFARLTARLQRRKMIVWGIAAFILLAQIALITRYFSPIYQANKLEKSVAQTVLDYPNRTIYTFAIDGALRSYGVKNKLVNLWREPIRKVDPGSLALFNEEKFARQWAGKNPMLNWHWLRQNFQLIELETLPDGWRLYEIKNECY